MTQQHFTHNLSRRLQEIGIELPETEKMWCMYREGIHGHYDSPRLINRGELKQVERWEEFSALSFSDVVQLMPRVEEKCGWIPVVCGKCGAAWSLPSHCCGEEPGEMTKSYEFVSHRLLDHFLAGQSDGTSWERAEAYLMSITEVK